MWKGKSPYVTSDFLSARHPYREKSFRSRLKDIKNQVFDGFGDDSYVRNINALKNSEFPVDEKLKSLVLVNKKMVLPENIIKGIDFGIVTSLVHVFRDLEDITLHEYGGRVVQSLCSLPQGAKAFFKEDGLELLVNVIRKTERKYLKARCSACAAILVFSRSTETCKLLWEKNNDVVNTLIWILDMKESKANSELLLHTLETLNEICRNPRGRDIAASNKIVDYLKKVFSERKSLGFNLNLQKKLLNSPALRCTRAATLCVWNVCLDGKGKELSKDIMKVISRVLIKALEVQEIEIIRFITGSILFICIFEDAKPVSLEPLFEDVDICTASILCDIVELVKGESGKLNSMKDGLNTIENIKKNTVLALKSIAKYPRGNKFIRSYLKKRGMQYYRAVFPKKN